MCPHVTDGRSDGQTSSTGCGRSLTQLADLAALIAIVWFVASCGGPAYSTGSPASPSVGPRSTGAAPSLSSTATPAPTSAPSAASDACTVAPPVTVTLPPALAKLDGSVAGLTDRGELIVRQSHAGLGGGILTVFDPATGATQPVVTRPPAKSQAEATSQVGPAAGNATWIVWEEQGFTLEVGDWSMWAMERATGTIHKIASFEPGANGKAVPDWPSNVSLSGDLAAWSASIEVPGDKIEPRIYVANLRERTARRLDVEGRWPSFLASDVLSAVVRAGTDENGRALAVPATIAIADGAVTKQDWMDPVRVLAYAASGSGSVAVRLVKEATAEDPVTVADAVTRDARGTIRSFALPNDWGDVAAGTGYLAWSDAQHLWVLPSGQVDPRELATVDPDVGLATLASGSTLYWGTGGEPVAPATMSTVAVSCP
jgi:hypothetical protein